MKPECIVGFEVPARADCPEPASCLNVSLKSEALDDPAIAKIHPELL
jgi:hypothetical protein